MLAAYSFGDVLWSIFMFGLWIGTWCAIVFAVVALVKRFARSRRTFG